MADYGAMVIGPGWVAGEHVKGYCQDPRTEIRAIVGCVPEDKARAEAYMAEFGFRADYYEDLDQALARDDIQIVSVCTFNCMHYEQTLACIQAGKNVLCEKPLCFTVAEAEELKALADAKKALSLDPNNEIYQFVVARFEVMIERSGVQ